MRIRGAIALSITWALPTVEAAADVLLFDCVGQESSYAASFAEHQANVTQRPLAIRIEMDRDNKSMSVKGTSDADGAGPLSVSPEAFKTIFEKTRIIYEVPFKYVQVQMLQAQNSVLIFAVTHLDLSEPNAEGRVLFTGNCRLPKRN